MIQITQLYEKECKLYCKLLKENNIPYKAHKNLGIYIISVNFPFEKKARELLDLFWENYPSEYQRRMALARQKREFHRPGH